MKHTCLSKKGKENECFSLSRSFSLSLRFFFFSLLGSTVESVAVGDLGNLLPLGASKSGPPRPGLHFYFVRRKYGTLAKNFLNVLSFCCSLHLFFSFIYLRLLPFCFLERLSHQKVVSEESQEKNKKK